jgi:hypothetical protein
MSIYPSMANVEEYCITFPSASIVIAARHRMLYKNDPQFIYFHIETHFHPASNQATTRLQLALNDLPVNIVCLILQSTTPEISPSSFQDNSSPLSCPRRS